MTPRQINYFVNNTEGECTCERYMVQVCRYLVDMEEDGILRLFCSQCDESLHECPCGLVSDDAHATECVMGWEPLTEED